MSVSRPVPERTSHPFLTYEMIREIPDGLRRTMNVMEKEATYPLPGPVTFTGCGTSFFAARMGSQVLELSDLRWKAVPAFELMHYSRLGGGVVVGVSHSGITKATIDALAMAKKEGALTVGLTHFAGRPISGPTERVHVIGNGPDRSRCHTKTYTDSAAAVLSLSMRCSEVVGMPLDDVAKEFGHLPEDLGRVMAGSEGAAKEAAEALSEVKRVYIAGAGPNVVTAMETALKFKETSYIGAEGFELEEILHGPWTSIDDETLVVVISSAGSTSERAATLLKASRGLGATTLVVSDSDFDADYVIRVPSTHEYLTPFLSIVPLYFLSYFTAVRRGHNPDYLRYLEERYWDARQVIFPPGTH